jgi:hypothetical protein
MIKDYTETTQRITTTNTSIGKSSKENLILPIRSRNTKHRKTDSKTSLMGVIKLYMNDKTEVDKIKKSSKYLNTFNTLKEKRPYRKTQQKTYDMVRPVSKFNTTKQANNNLPNVNDKHNTNSFNKASFKLNKGHQLSHDQQMLSFIGDRLNTENRFIVDSRLNTDNPFLTEEVQTNTLTSLNNLDNKIIINKSNVDKLCDNIIKDVNDHNGNIINIVNNVTNERPNDVVKVKMNVYGINVLMPNDNIKIDEPIDSDKTEDIDIRIISDTEQKNRGKVVGETDTAPLKLRSYNTFNFTPKMQIDIKRTPANKTLSLRINNVQHNINFQTNNDISKHILRATDTLRSLSVISSENSKLIKQTTRELYLNKDGNTTESVYNYSPVRKSIIRSSSNVDSDLGTVIIRKKVSIVTPNMTEDHLDKETMYRGISVKLTERAESFGLSKYNTDNVHELAEEDDSEDEGGDFIRERVRIILRKVGEQVEDDDYRSESKLHSSNFIRHVHRTSTLLKNFRTRIHELKEVMKFLSKSVEVKKSNYIKLTKHENLYKRTSSAKLVKANKHINLQSGVMKIVLDTETAKRSFIDLHKNQHIEFKLINIHALKDLIVTESLQSSTNYIKSMVNHALANKTKKAKNKRLIEFYKTGLRKRIMNELLEPSNMQPLIRRFTIDVESLQYAATDMCTSKYLRNSYFNIYPELLLSIYKNFNNFNNNLAEKVLHSDLFVNFRNGNIAKRSSRLCVFDYDFYRPPILRSESLKKIYSSPFLGVRNDNFVHVYIRRDHPNTKADEQKFFNQMNSSSDSVDTVKTCKKHASVKFRSDIFMEYMKDLKTSKLSHRKHRASVMINVQSSVKDNENLKGRLQFKRKKKENGGSTGIFRKSKYKGLATEEANPDRPVLNIIENAKYLITSRNRKLY